LPINILYDTAGGHGFGLRQRGADPGILRHVGDPDVTARLLRQASQVVRHASPPARQRRSTAEDRSRVGGGDDFDPTVAKVEHKRSIETISAVAQNDPAYGLRFNNSRRANGVPRPIPCRERPGHRAGVGVIAAGGDMELCSTQPGQRREHPAGPAGLTRPTPRAA
jgi:hypothetical protein